MTWLHSYSQMGVDIGMTRSLSLQGPDFLNMTITCTNQALVSMGYVILVYNKADLDLSKSPVTNIFISIDSFTPIIQPTTFGLPTYFTTTMIGFKKYCALGFFSFETAADDQFIVSFDTNHNPIASINIVSTYLNLQ